VRLFYFHLPCCALHFLRTYPAVRLFYFRLPCCALHFLRTYPAVRLFYFHLPCCALHFLRTYPAAPLFYFHLPCCALIFLRTPAVRLFFFALSYPAVPLFSAHLPIYDTLHMSLAFEQFNHDWREAWPRPTFESLLAIKYGATVTTIGQRSPLFFSDFQSQGEGVATFHLEWKSK